MDRSEELAANLARVRERITGAVHAAGRSTEPELIVVTKFFPASDVRILAGLGVRDVGENRDQEAGAKAADVDDARLTWHFIGQLQANKAKSVVRYAGAVHSVDRLSLVKGLDKAMRNEQDRRDSAGLEARQPMVCFLQVNLDPEDTGGDGRGGMHPRDVPALAEAVAQSTTLDLAGVMAVAPLGGDPAVAFENLARISDEVQTEHPHAAGISAGMSHDLEQAVAAGATHLRIGSNVLGARPPVR